MRYALIVPKRCERYAQWDGERIDARAGETVFGADAAYEADERAAAYATEAVRNARGGVFVDLDKVDEDASVVHRALGARARGGGGGDGVRPVRGLSHRLRWRKSDAELALIKNSVDLDVQAFVKAFQTSRAGATEADVMAQHEAACRIGGADRLAYPSVVGSGAGACVVHYHQNDKMLEDGDLLLMDAGCELNGYVSDITRTWPISGRWTQAQLDVYSVVLEAHDACLRAARADGETSLMDIHQALHRRSRQRPRQALAQYLRPRADSLGRVRQILPPLRRPLARRRHPRRPIRRGLHPVRKQRRLHHRTRFIFLPPRPRHPRRSPRNRRSHRRRLRRRRQRRRRRPQRRAPHRSRRRRRARVFHVFPTREFVNSVTQRRITRGFARRRPARARRASRAPRNRHLAPK